METIFEEKREYDAKYDILKLFLSLMIAAMHAEICPMTCFPWLRTAVPLFFMMSSYFLFSKLADKPEQDQKNRSGSMSGEMYASICFGFLVYFGLCHRRCTALVDVQTFETSGSRPDLPGGLLYSKLLFRIPICV